MIEANLSPRRQAAKDGIGIYFTGKACVNGHLAGRRTSNGRCLECESKQGALWVSRNPESRSLTRKSYYQKNRQSEIEYQAERRDKNPEYVRSQNAKWYELNKEKKQKYNNSYKAKNKEVLNRKRRERKAINPAFLLSERLRARIVKAIARNGYKKTSSTAAMVGCSWEELKIHIEDQFVDGMGWENRHDWHIDHIIPLSSAKTEEDIFRLNHYTNLRPMWAKENQSKGNKIEGSA